MPPPPETVDEWSTAAAAARPALQHAEIERRAAYAAAGEGQSDELVARWARRPGDVGELLEEFQLLLAHLLEGAGRGERRTGLRYFWHDDPPSVTICLRTADPASTCRSPGQTR
jgi:hypothetical protein